MIAAIVLLVAVLGGAVAVMVPAYLRQRIPWKRTPSGFRYHALGAVDPHRIDVNARVAFQLLREYTDLAPSTIDATRIALHVLVQKTNVWESPLHGGNVAGVTSGTTIGVGVNLAALCHEIAHACEFIEGGADRQDTKHLTWEKRGIQRAVDEYERDWVKA